MAVESCQNVKTKIASSFICSAFERNMSLAIDSMFRHPFGCPAKYQLEGAQGCDTLSDCTIVHCLNECEAPEGFIAEVNDPVDVVYVRETEIGRPVRGAYFFFKGGRYRLDSVTGSCGYTWRCIIVEDEDSCVTGGCGDVF